MSIWDKIRDLAVQDAKKFIYTRIAPAHTREPAGIPITAYKGYVRVQLADMFLAKSRNWFKDWQPCVGTQLRLELDGQKGQIISHVARPPQDAMGPGVRVNYQVSDLLPFSGGVVEIEAGLLALKGADYIAAALGVLSSFSDLVPGPIGQAVGIAQKISAGLDQLTGAVDSQVHLGFHDSFGSEGGNSTLTSGYLAVILATKEEVSEAYDGAPFEPLNRLGVADKRLYIESNGAWEQFTGFDYMLYYIEGRVERDNWRLPSIQAPLDKAIEATILGENAEAYKKAALVAALTCKELTPLDRRRVAAAVKAEIEGLQNAGQGAVGGGPRELTGIVAAHETARPAAQPEDVPTEADILA